MRSAPLLLLPLLLSGCSGTPFGESLSRSFSGPPASTPTIPTPTTPAPAIPGPPIPKPTSPPPKPESPIAAKSAPAAPAPAAGPLRPPRDPAPAVPAPSPAPYRVTILLPQADPAAPAEALTRALRTAGVPFEVETIQRTVPGAPALPAPSSAPAVPATPAVRSAPTPR